MANAREGSFHLQIIKGRVNWWATCDNNPVLQLLVDHVPLATSLTYTKYPTNHGYLYYAEQDGYVRFYAYAQPGKGLGGSRYTLNIDDGTTETLIGPWSSRAGAVNTLGVGPVCDVSMTDSPKAYDRGWTFLATACTLAAVEASTDKIDIGSGYVRLDSYGKPREGCEYTAFPSGSRLLMLPNRSPSGDIIYIPVVQYPNGDIWTKSPSHIDNHENWLEWKEMKE